MSLRGKIEPLPWESDFFQLVSAKVLPDASGEPLTEQQFAAFARLQAKIAADDTGVLDTLLAEGFQLVEGEIDFCIHIADPPCAVASHHATTQDIASICALAEQAFLLSRFRTPWYQPGDSSRFYRLWAEKAVLGTFDHLCLLIKNPQNQMQGFVTLRQISGDTARIGLLAVGPQYQGQGVGKKLMAAARQWCASHQLSQLYVATQCGNLAALNLYLASGGKIASSAYWLYK